jgi:septum formation protein
MSNKIILASQSPRRKELLELAAIECEVFVSNSDESYPSHLSFEETAVYIAKNKAMKIVDDYHPNIPVLAADTIVVCDNEVIGKPKDRDDAINILKKLSGKTHNVITGVFIYKSNDSIAFSDTTSVTFHTLTANQIEYYVDHYKPYDKAGAYAIQEWIGVVGIKSINGDFYNVMGLPVSRIVPYL